MVRLPSVRALATAPPRRRRPFLPRPIFGAAMDVPLHICGSPQAFRGVSGAGGMFGAGTIIDVRNAMPIAAVR